MLKYQINNIKTSIPGLINMLKIVKPILKKKAKTVMLMDSFGYKRSSKKKKNKNPMKVKGGVTKKKAIKKAPKRTYFHCGQKWSLEEELQSLFAVLEEEGLRCPIYLRFFFIEVNSFSNYNQWVMDAGYGSHICTDMWGLRNDRKLNKGEADLGVGNGARVATLVIGPYVLSLPSGLLLKLENFYYSIN